jgi:hypothetical protein
MSNISVTAHEQNGHLIYVCDRTGQPYANLAQCEKIFPDVPKHKLHYRLKGVEKGLVKSAQVQTGGGMQGVELYPASVILDLAIEFDQALAKKIGSAGAAVYLYGLAGFRVSPTLENDRLSLEKTLMERPTLKQIEQAGRVYGRLYGKAYEQQYVQQKYQHWYPALTGHQADPSQVASLPSVKHRLTPSDIAKELGLLHGTGTPNGNAANKLMESLGYLTKIDKIWVPTDKAVNAGYVDRKPVDTNSRTQKDQLLWSIDILPVLREHCVGISAA